MLIDNGIKLVIEMSLIDMANAVGGILCGHEDGNENKVRKSHEEYMKLERLVKLGMQLMEDAKLKEWDWKYATCHGWLCDMDFKWFKKELTDEGIFKNDYLKNWKEWKKKFDRKNCPECKGHGGTYVPDNMGQPMGVSCETCRDKEEYEEVPSEYKILANASKAIMQKKWAKKRKK